MTDQNFEHMRRAMVASQLRTTGVNNPRVVAAMGAVPRERFVPADRIPIAYADALVPLGGGRQLNTPMALGKLLTEADPQQGERMLVVGAATGYAAAVAARLTDSVVALEEDKALLAAAKMALAGTIVKLVEGPLAKGHKKGAPYDLILIDGAVEFVPDALIDQLAEGGRLATALLDQGVSRLAIGRKAGQGFGLAAFSDAASAILPGFAKARSFTF
ncbi:protein-L-isoaspartate O-methyltransferase family protein [Sphingosinicella rhizophila]|uniref:Protein-L-isoaspartate O-methyltransferase n=1 Tax=Sphingosinicella rhizophila TaxID=3050082 RepID=A0ABU3Q4P9_9SPHN|nr:protein-L-isoaspartate O-methyltransferase [Sphingosinicella sp. GR2756]MDT9597910.1 protein-L-isoaspartate O-methyltransferase [Sphingosinicella sp. GR2756]